MFPTFRASLWLVLAFLLTQFASAVQLETVFALEVADSSSWTRETEVLGDPGDNRCTGQPFLWAANDQNNAAELFVFNCEPVHIPPGMTIIDVWVDVFAVYQDGNRGPLQLEVKVPGFMPNAGAQVRRERRCLPMTPSGDCFWRFNENQTSPNGVSIYQNIVNVFGGPQNFQWDLVHTLDLLISRRGPSCVTNTSNLKVKGVRMVVQYGPDCDGDGRPDAGELDSDGDGTINDCDECPFDPNKVLAGACGCGVSDVDSDSDGTPDCDDECPLDPDKIFAGTCGCGTPDVDTDGDGVLDCDDLCPNDPNKIAPGDCGCGTADTDSDGDGVPDCHDMCPNDPNKIVPGACGCDVPDIDSDGDGVLDCDELCPNDPTKLVPGICGCGTPETDSDGDGAPDCIDECPNDALKILAGACGCGSPDVDSDGDGVFDCFDLCMGFDDNLDCNGNGLIDGCEGAPDCNLNGIPDECDIASGFSLDANGDGVPDDCPELFTPFCFCASAAPCNNADSAAGCINSTNFGSALAATGSTSVSLDDLTLTMTGVPPNSFGVFFMGAEEIAPITLGGGQRCVGGTIFRFPAGASGSAGQVSYGPVVGFSTATFPAVGQIAAGQTWNFQGWFRDGGGPCGAGFNTSNAIRVIFVP